VRRSLVTGGVALLALVAACGDTTPEAAPCDDAPDGVAEALGEHLLEGGNIRFPVVYRPDGADHVFVSFENRTDDDVADDDSGDILTVVAPDEDSTEYSAVDERAREQTDLPESDLDVRTDGAVTSRGCVVARRE
jgi:hypothetical protein